MWFKNLQIYRLPAGWLMAADQLGTHLAQQSFAPCSSNELLRQGWVEPRTGCGLVYSVNKQFLLQLRTEKKLLPASVINQAAQARAAEMEEAQGFAPGKKAMKELKERVADELLPRAFTVRSQTFVWIDPVNGWLVVDAASPSKADDVVKMLLKAVDRMPLESLRVQRSPVAVMTAWLDADEAPAGFTVDQDAIMQASGESKASVRYVKHTLETDDIRRHIKAGKQCKRLAMTWNDKVSFVLDESLAVKSVRALDVIKEGAAAHDDSERLDNDFMLMTGELAKMLADLVEALGGAAEGDAAVARPAAVRQQKIERAVGLSAELYKVRALHREVLNELYEKTIQPYIARVRDEMADTGKSAIKCAIDLSSGMPPGLSSGQMFLVAAVEILEPSPSQAVGDEPVREQRPVNGQGLGAAPVPDSSADDPLYDAAVTVVRTNRRASISLVQRHLRIGYSRAAWLLDAMEQKGVVSAMQSNGNRDVLAVAA